MCCLLSIHLIVVFDDRKKPTVQGARHTTMQSEVEQNEELAWLLRIAVSFG
jgi:hypothetical protein